MISIVFRETYTTISEFAIFEWVIDVFVLLDIVISFFKWTPREKTFSLIINGYVK